MPDECPHSDDDAAAAVLHVTQSLEDDPSAASVESVASLSVMTTTLSSLLVY